MAPDDFYVGIFLHDSEHAQSVSVFGAYLCDSHRSVPLVLVRDRPPNMLLAWCRVQQKWLIWRSG